MNVNFTYNSNEILLAPLNIRGAEILRNLSTCGKNVRFIENDKHGLMAIKFNPPERTSPMLKTTINITINSHNLKQRNKMLKAVVDSFIDTPFEPSSSKHSIRISKSSDARANADLEHFHTGRVETKAEKAKRKAAKNKPIPEPNGKAKTSYKDLTK